ncbi:MAG: 50S ribosomal protein L35 [Coriobacteriia bacterium]|nr:50S ribosomal protein L35 [Coriobacteriia bacterium]
MPKMRTHRGSIKRFRVTGSGKIMRGNAYKSHLKVHKSPKQKRDTKHAVEVSAADYKVIARNLGLR